MQTLEAHADDLNPLRAAILDALPISLYVVDRDFRIVEWNTGREEGPLGRPRAEVLGRPLELVLSAEGLRDTLPVLRRVFESGRAAEEIRQTEDGRFFNLRRLPICQDGEVAYVLSIAEDVTQHKLLERMREDLTHTMVHDLRNPLTSIRGFLELQQLSADTLASGQREMLRIATSSVRRLVCLVDSILDVSRLEHGGWPVRPERLCVANLVAEILALEHPLAREKELRLLSFMPAGLPAAWADGGLVRRVVQNLVDNAIKFTPLGGEVRVSARRSDSGRLEVAVSDTGPGVPPELQGRLFEKFVTGGQKGGSGLGLAFCRLAVEAHGGRVWTESRSGEGATFGFCLPVAA